MNFSDPSLTISPTLDGSILIALDNAGKPLTVSEVAVTSTRGSEIGIRKAIGRLVTQGIVTVAEIGRTRVYSLNRNHVAAGIVTELTQLRSETWRRVSRQLEKWEVSPLYASVFGSAARGDGDSESDIDLLLIRPSTLAEISAARKSRSVMNALGTWADIFTTRVVTEAQLDKFDSKVDKLRDLVPLWTGNPLQVVILTAVEWTEHRRKRSRIYMNVVKDEIRLCDAFGLTTYRYPKHKGN
jgi:predicted nucleotidyltransferase